MPLESKKILEAKSIPYRLIRLSDKAVSCEDVVKLALDKVKPEEICKTIVVKDKAGGQLRLPAQGEPQGGLFQGKANTGGSS